MKRPEAPVIAPEYPSSTSLGSPKFTCTLPVERFLPTEDFLPAVACIRFSKAPKSPERSKLEDTAFNIEAVLMLRRSCDTGFENLKDT